MSKKKVPTVILPGKYRQELAKLLEEKKNQNSALQKLILELEKNQDLKQGK